MMMTIDIVFKFAKIVIGRKAWSRKIYKLEIRQKELWSYRYNEQFQQWYRGI